MYHMLEWWFLCTAGRNLEPLNLNLLNGRNPEKWVENLSMEHKIQNKGKLQKRELEQT